MGSARESAEGGRHGIAGGSQEAGGGQARRQERHAATHSYEPEHLAGEGVSRQGGEVQEVVNEVDEAELEAWRQMEQTEFDDDILAGPEDAHSSQLERPADGQAAVEGLQAYDPEDPFGLEQFSLPTRKKGGDRGSQKELVQQPVPSLHSGAVHSVPPEQVGESSAAAGGVGHIGSGGNRRGGRAGSQGRWVGGSRGRTVGRKAWGWRSGR